MKFPNLKISDSIHADPKQMIPMIGITDCQDLLDVLCQSAVTSVTNKAMILYIAALRELKATCRIEEWCWVDTRDNLANTLTKLNADGCLPLEPVTHMCRHAAWEPVEPFRWGQNLRDPTASNLTLMKVPEPLPNDPTQTIPAQPEEEDEDL